jgi:hypothetical protein
LQLLPEGLGGITGGPIRKLGCEHLPLPTILAWVLLAWILLVGIVVALIVVGHGCPVGLEG